jgi:hypothetical protein
VRVLVVNKASGCFQVDNSVVKDSVKPEFDVFLSYFVGNRRNADEFCEMLKNKHNLKVWMMKEEDKMNVKVENYIKKSKCFISLISKDYVETQICCNEFKLAIFYQKRLFLVMSENVKLDEYPNFRYHAIGIQRFDLCKSKNTLIEEVIKVCRPEYFVFNYEDK